MQAQGDFADEPTGNLDTVTTRKVLGRILKMAKENGITFVMVTHERELAGCADRVVTISDGNVQSDRVLTEEEKAAGRAAPRGGPAGGFGCGRCTGP